MALHNNSQDSIGEGNDLYSVGKYIEALNAYQRALLYGQDNSAWIAHLQMGWCYYSLFNITDAELSWKSAIKLQPENPRVILSLTTLSFFKEKLLGRRQFKQTRERLEHLKSLLDSGQVGQEVLQDYILYNAHLNLETNNLLEAEPLIKMLQQERNYPSKQVAYAHYLRKREQYKEAYEIYEENLHRNPFLFTTYEGFARCALALKITQHAQQILNNYLVVYPHFHYIYYWQGWLYFQTRDYQRACSFLERSVQLCPWNALGCYYLGCTLLRLFKPYKARIQFEKSAQLFFSYVSEPTLDYCCSLRGEAIANLMGLNWIKGIKQVWVSLSSMHKIFLARLQEQEEEMTTRS